MRKWNSNRFFIDAFRPSVGNIISIDDKDQIKHISCSLRLEVGDNIELCFIDKLECIGCIEHIDKHSITLKNIENCKIANELDVKIDLYQGVPKLKKIDLIVQKSVECGVHSINPVNMQNCVANIKEEKSKKKIQRLQKIAYSAAEQAKRLYVPNVNEVIDSKNLKDSLKDYDLIILADEDLSISDETGNSIGLKSIESEIKKAKSIALVIGPEGGLSTNERKLLKDIAHSISLGSRILRTETAAIFVLAQLNYILF